MEAWPDHRRPPRRGGDTHGVAIGRALVRRPKPLLMDEPIGALDAKLREEMRAELKHIHRQNEATTVYVTHDQVEAMAMADRIAIMDEGVLQQVGSPSDVYQQPANLFVAQFVGSPIMNVTTASVRPGDGHSSVVLGEDDPVLRFPAALYQQVAAHGRPDDGLRPGVRHEGVVVDGQATDCYLPVEAPIIEPLGPYDIVDLKFGKQLLRARTPSGYVERVGQVVWARLDERQTHLFDARTGESLRIKL